MIGFFRCTISHQILQQFDVAPFSFGPFLGRAESLSVPPSSSGAPFCPNFGGKWCALIALTSFLPLFPLSGAAATLNCSNLLENFRQ
jgi:hypothetical protein